MPTKWSHAGRGGLILLLAAIAACGRTGATPAPAPAEPPGAASNTTVSPATNSTIEPAGRPTGALGQATSSWNTDFSQASIPLEELLVGIPAPDPRDLIAPIDDPKFEDVATAGGWLEDPEPGILVEVDGAARFYPLRILTRHEIVNDTFGGRPVVITYCPLCNTALAFDPVVGGEPLRFGVSGLLRHSDLVMWDDRTESLWQQITGEAIVGSLTGTKLDRLPSAIVAWADFSASHPNAEVLSRDTGSGIAYGANPYVGYTSSAVPFLFDGEIDERYPALERVVGVTIGETEKAYPFSLLAGKPAINDIVAGVPVVVLWGAPATADALDASEVAAGRGVGTGVAYLATVGDQTLTFTAGGGDRFVDAETGSTWTLLGEAVEGPLAGTRLEFAPHRNEFWFAWQVFFPDAEVWAAG